MDKLINPAQPPDPADDERAWVSTMRRDIPVHRLPEGADTTVCGRSTRYGEIVTVGEARKYWGSKPCARCWPAAADKK